MTMRMGLILMAATAFAVGCRRPDPTVDLMEAELRWMEDQLYRMEDEYQQKCAELASCRRENRSLRKDDGSEPRPATMPPAPAVDEGDVEPDLAPPTVEEGQEVQPQAEPPHPANLPLDINIRPAANFESSALPQDTRVTQIVLNHRLTGGIDLDGRPGDEGLMLVIEPRNARGQYVPSPADVSVVVLDPSKSGNAARVARWDFDAAETRRLMRKTLFGRGIHVELPWPNEPPDSDTLRLYVRYTMVDGRRLQTETEIQVDPLGPRPQGWTPASSLSSADRSWDARVSAGHGSRDRLPQSARQIMPTHATTGRLLPLGPVPDTVAARPSPAVGTGLRGQDSIRGSTRVSATARRQGPALGHPQWRPDR